MARLQQRPANLLIRQIVGTHVDIGFDLDLRLDLRLPLILLEEAGRHHGLQQMLRAVRLPQQLGVQPVLGDAVPAVGRYDDGASLAHHLRCRAHPLHRLVEVQVERIARVGGDDDIERPGHRDHRRGFGERAAGRMRGIKIAGIDPGDRLVAVERHVHQEGVADDAGDLHHLFPGRVALRYPPNRVGVGEHGRVVVAQHRPQPRHPRHQRLAAAGKAGKQVRFDEPGEDPHVACHDVTVHPDLVAARGQPE